MTQVHVTTETAYREALIEAEQRRNRVLVLAQQLADSQMENATLKDQIAALQPKAVEPPAS